jgi:YfiH family protein
VPGSLELVDAGLPAGVEGWFTTRFGGVSRPPWDGLNLGPHVGDDPQDVFANADLLAAHLGVTGLNFPQQVHGASVLLVDEARRGYTTHSKAAGVDALVTHQPGIPVGVLVADCMPVLLADPVARIVGAAHAGRRGLAGGVLEATVAVMVDLGAEEARLVAVVGPSICGRCYEVPPQMQAEVAAAVPGTACDTAQGTAGLDLPAGALRVLRGLGVEASATGICTAEDDRFYSFRRDGVTGRFAGIVMLSPDG